MQMHTVTLTMSDIETETPRDAAFAFLAALMSADWSPGMTFTVTDSDGHRHRITLGVADVQEATTRKDF